MDLTRREMLRLGLAGGVALAVGPVLLTACDPYGTLLDPDANGLKLPEGFSSRVIATTGVAVPGTAYVWHSWPDGGATFATGDGGWIYVSNSEIGSGGGGVGMVRFDSAGTIVDATSILSGTSRNCAGGATPWGTWLSCEETAQGAVFECDPTGVAAAVRHDAMGWFNHEAAAVDPVGQVVYLTEDRPDGGLYRFTPTTYPDLSAGLLEVLTESAGVLGWAALSDPTPTALETQTRYQVADIRTFNGGEGICLRDGVVYFTTKGDNRVWRFDPGSLTLDILYDDDTASNPVLTGVDNITVTPVGDLYIAEDGGDMQICLINLNAEVFPFLELTGVAGSEITGPAFDPSGTRLYFSSQRNPGVTYEVSGPFRG